MNILTPESSDFKKVLEELSKQSKIQTLETGFLVKYQREMAGEDDDKREKQLDKINDTLNKILSALGGKPSKTTQDNNSEGFSWKDDLKKFKEELKSGVAFSKKIGGGVVEAFKSPLQTFKKGTIGAAKLNENVFQQTSEILSAQPDESNIVDQPSEIIAQETKKQSVIIDNLLDTTKESLNELKSIANSLEGKIEPLPSSKSNQTQQQSAPVEPAPGAPGVGIDVPLSRPTPSAPGAPGPQQGKPGLGSKILKGAATVGKFALGALMSKPMLIAAGVGLAAYGAYKGYKALTEPKDSQTSSPVEEKSSVGEAIAKTSESTPKRPSVKEQMEGDDNLEKFQMAKAELQGLQKEYSDEKFKVQEEFGNKKETRGTPEHKAALKAVDDKYLPLIDAQKKEVEKLSKAPGIKEAKAREKSFDDSLEGKKQSDSTSTNAKATPKETYSKSTTTTETSITGGGSTETKRVRTADAQAAQKEMTALDGKQEQERNQIVEKLKSEGKIGKFATLDDYENVPELKELTAKQDKERAFIQSRIDAGTSTQTTRTAPPPSTSTAVSSISTENNMLRDEMGATASTQPIVMNNVSSNNTNTYVPIKGEPRATHRGSALDNYYNRVTVY